MCHVYGYRFCYPICRCRKLSQKMLRFWRERHVLSGFVFSYNEAPPFLYKSSSLKSIHKSS